jgi:hypothetical protein
MGLQIAAKPERIIHLCVLKCSCCRPPFIEICPSAPVMTNVRTQRYMVIDETVHYLFIFNDYWLLLKPEIVK